MRLDEFAPAFKRIEAWWKNEMIDRACIAFSLSKPEFKPVDLNALWRSEGSKPDIQRIIDSQIDYFETNMFFGDSLPALSHKIGGRAFPMTIAAYLGGKVKFGDTTVWTDPVIDDWKKFDIKFDPDNIWWKRSLEFFTKTAEESKGRYLPVLSDYGDCLTVFSLLRGTQNLIMDIMDDKETIKTAQKKFFKIWPRFHKEFWDIYKKYSPGDTSWCIWAPGKTYACQCDFSTMMSPALFEELVVPEIEEIGKYLDYIIWHLDGPEEHKYLDMLLDLPQIKAIEFVQVAGKAPTVECLPVLKKIQSKKRSLKLYPRNEKDIEILLTELSPEGLYFSGGFTGKTEKEANALIKMVEKLSLHK